MEPDTLLATHLNGETISPRSKFSETKLSFYLNTVWSTRLFLAVRGGGKVFEIGSRVGFHRPTVSDRQSISRTRIGEQGGTRLHSKKPEERHAILKRYRQTLISVSADSAGDHPGAGRSLFKMALFRLAPKGINVSGSKNAALRQSFRGPRRATSLSPHRRERHHLEL